jgi:hypothetical protein
MPDAACQMSHIADRERQMSHIAEMHFTEKNSHLALAEKWDI